MNSSTFARDTLLLLVGCFLMALMPWNPALWYMLSRLQLAVELDCDQRVLQTGIAKPTYAALLLELSAFATGMRHGLPALSFGQSHLEQRLLAMTPTMKRRARHHLAAATVVMVTVLVACEARIPADPTQRGVVMIHSAGSNPFELPARNESVLRTLYAYNPAERGSGGHAVPATNQNGGYAVQDANARLAPPLRFWRTGRTSLNGTPVDPSVIDQLDAQSVDSIVVVKNGDVHVWTKTWKKH